MCTWNLELTKIVTFVYSTESRPKSASQTQSTIMDPLLCPSPPRECSHSSCRRTIPATEAGVKQPKTCAECRAQDNASKKRRRDREKAAAQQTTNSAPDGISDKAPTAKKGPNGQKRKRQMGPTDASDSSDDDEVNVSDTGIPISIIFTYNL